MTLNSLENQKETFTPSPSQSSSSGAAIFSLSGSTVVITGAGRGLGLTLAFAVVEADGHVACLDIAPDPIHDEWAQLQEVAKSRNLTASYHKCDVTSETELKSVLESIAESGAERNAPLSGVVACAGIQQKCPALDYPAADFERILRVNVTGVFLTAKHAANIMVEKRIKGSIVLIGSMSGQIANRGLTCSAYNTSKAAVQQMCRSLAQEWGQYGIRINTLSPGYIRTAMTDELLAAEPEVEKTWLAGALLGRLGLPEDFKAPAIFLDFEIIDVTDSVIKEHQDLETDTERGSDGDIRDPAPSSDIAVQNTLSHPSEPLVPPSGHQSEVDWQEAPDRASSLATSLYSYTTGNLPSSGNHDLDEANHQIANCEPISSPSQSISDPYSVDGIDPLIYTSPFSDTTYHQLQSALRHYMFQESQSRAPTRPSSPSHDHGDLGGVLIHSHYSSEPRAVDSRESDLLDDEQKFRLWKVWIEEVSPWANKFDRDQHFRNTLPTLSRSHEHLKYAMMALSARQIERQKNPAEASSLGLRLYQRAIRLLIPCLSSRNTAVIASCVVLCVLEMLDCSPRAWQQHLDGCAALLQAVSINGFSGSVEEALFWCFARMDVCGGLIASMKTLIPVSAWAPTPDLQTTVQLFRLSPHAHESHAKQALYLLAHAVGLLSSRQTALAPFSLSGLTESSDHDFNMRWLELWQLLEDWHTDRPAEMFPAFTTNSLPFPTILYLNPSAISGTQLYHTASLLMLLHRPLNCVPSPKPRSILWHARRIVAISASNSHHGCWTNALQPLWIAGRVFSSRDEHKFILDLLERIERETGWATRWRADDLREWWGED
ncbi:hypothetical protein SCAR479_10756 [Seiridium cardinale]|uniref:Uncharacterized protein n=1 Tax=Seiridium cardinale TaxID=138064 RepID=A0ABR2XFR3_9PEZI